MVSQSAVQKIALLSEFKADIQAYLRGSEEPDLRTRINRRISKARDIVTETGAIKSVTLSPPPMIGGLIIRNADPFNFIVESYYGMTMIPAVCDMIDEAIGVLEDPEYEAHLRVKEEEVRRLTSNASAGRSGEQRDPEVPEKVTLSWLVKHVPVAFWLWLFGIIAAAVALGVKVGTRL